LLNQQDEAKARQPIRHTEIALQTLTISDQQKQKVFFTGGLLLLGIIGGLIFYQSRNRKKTNTTLMVLNTELDEANKIKTKFFSILTHDLRGPVVNLINFLHLQQQAPDLLNKEATESHTKKITVSAENLLENMEGLLLWSKGQMEHFKPNKKNVGVSKLFTDIENNFLGTADVKFIFENSQQININTDEDYLKTIMRNLTGNAIKALSNTTNATIEWKAWEQDGKQYLSIRDNGNGIDEQQLNALNNGDAAVGIKTGLGFHLVRDMAKAIACSISVNSVPGRGTIFQLTV
jgi:signal transduction histidine kinase